ncbi:MAG: sulfatase-like hydrolase/transferase [Opitutaceae bacterium]|nr:sulfatase-like hydrolase/transferase [Opitutaceae bacterium]
MGKKHNIIYILTDQHRWDMLGCAGHPTLKTPNIDRLAREGISFTRAFTPTAICGPARASLYTGLVPTEHGVVGNSEGKEKVGIKEGVRGINEYLTGYNSILAGKWHVDDDKLPTTVGFTGHDFSGYAFPGSDVYQNFAFPQSPLKGNPYSEWLERKGFAIPTVSESVFGAKKTQEFYGKLSGPAEASIPHFIVDESKTLVNEATQNDEPFFLWMNFWGPHTPCVLPQPYFSMYNPEDIPEDPGFAETFENKPIHQRFISHFWGVDAYDWSDWQQFIARYMGYITLIDDCIGDFFRYLEERGLYDDTVIVFTSDHGDAVGAHRLIEKGEFMYEETARIPFVVRHPDCQTPGTTSDAFVYFHDLCPTAAEIATGEAPDLGQAESILPLMLDNTATNDREYVYAQFTRHFMNLEHRMLRTRTHKLVFNASTIGELYDLEKDPHELTNQIDNPDYAEIKKDLFDKLCDEMEQIKDPLLSWVNSIRDIY